MKDDIRIKTTLKNIKDSLRQSKSQYLTLDVFKDCIQNDLEFLEKIFTKQLIIQDFGKFSQSIEEIFENVKGNTEGKIATYIP